MKCSNIVEILKLFEMCVKLRLPLVYPIISLVLICCFKDYKSNPFLLHYNCLN